MTKKKNKNQLIEVNWKKLALFSSVFLVVFIGWKIIQSARYSADVYSEELGSNFVTTSTINLEVKKDGSVYKNDKKIASKIKPQKTYDDLRLIVYDKNGFYLDNLQVTLTLPDTVAKESNPQILAIHGVDSATATALNDRTISYEANGVNDSATITVVAEIPKGIIKLSLYDNLVFLLSSASGKVWVFVAIAIPLLTLIYMIMLISLQQRVQKIVQPDRAVSAPPMALPPAVVGVLMSQNVGPREIAATLIDLSLRKYIFIIDRDRGFSFGKRIFSGHLLSFEKMLLSKIFRENATASDSVITERFANHVYSHKMSLFTRDIYALATRLGYFKENPVTMHRKYQFFGTLLFFFGLACFFLSFKFFPSAPYTAFFWVGMMIASLVIIIIGSKMPIRTAPGRQALTNWLAFKKFLSDPAPLPYDANNYQKFVEYLPYAIVFHCEALWVKRFVDEEFNMPDWFITETQGLGLQDFCLSLFPIVGYIGQNLASIREPGYK